MRSVALKQTKDNAYFRDIGYNIRIYSNNTSKHIFIKSVIIVLLRALCYLLLLKHHFFFVARLIHDIISRLNEK